MPTVELKPVPDKPIDWRKVANSLRASGDQAEHELDFAPTHEKPSLAVVMATCRCVARAIEDGLS